MPVWTVTGCRMRIGIAGAGIGGLAAAALLARDGHQVTVFDQFEAPRPVGSGLVIQPVGMEVLDQVGAGDAARSLGAPSKIDAGTWEVIGGAWCEYDAMLPGGEAVIRQHLTGRGEMPHVIVHDFGLCTVITTGAASVRNFVPDVRASLGTGVSPAMA